MEPNRRIQMRTLFFVPALLGMLALGAMHTLAQPASAMQQGRDRRDQGNQRDRPSAYERRSEAPRNARSVVVPANVAWTNTGISVSKGQWLRFEPSGEVRLSFNGDDTATAAGAKSFRFAAK